MLNKMIFFSWTPVYFSCMRTQKSLGPLMKGVLASHWTAFISALQGRNLASGWTHDIPVNTFLQLVTLLLIGSTALQCTNHSCQLGASCSFTEDPSTRSSLSLRKDWMALIISCWLDFGSLATASANPLSTLERLPASAMDLCISRWSSA